MRRAVAVVTVAALVACGRGAGPAATSTPTSAGAVVSRVGTIVFEGGTASAARLYAVRPATGRERRLVPDAAAFEPQLSPDGRTLASSGPRPAQPSVTDAYVQSMTTGARRVVATGRCPSWSLDGTSVLVSTFSGLRRFSVTGTSSTIVPGAGSRCALEVAPRQYVLWDQGEALELLVDGKPRPLVRMPRCALGPVARDPGGTRIAFTAACPRATGGLYVTGLVKPEPVLVVPGVAYGATWSPDGTSLATALRPTGASDHQLWLVTADGHTRRRVAGDIVNAPTWGPTP